VSCEAKARDLSLVGGSRGLGFFGIAHIVTEFTVSFSRETWSVSLWVLLDVGGVASVYLPRVLTLYLTVKILVVLICGLSYMYTYGDQGGEELKAKLITMLLLMSISIRMSNMWRTTTCIVSSFLTHSGK